MSYNMVIIFRIPVSQLDDIALFYNDAYSLYLKSELTQSVYVYVILTMFKYKEKYKYTNIRSKYKENFRHHYKYTVNTLTE